MTPNPSKFTAAGPAAGYYFQARLALLESLRHVSRDPGIEVAIERLDDVSFESNGEPVELLQSKHHIGKIGDLTDSSPDIWKTLRVWAASSQLDPSLPGKTRLILVTTAHAPTGSAASFLRPNNERNTKNAEALLLTAASTSKNATLKDCFHAFQSLSEGLRKSLISAIEVIDNSPQVGSIDVSIEHELRFLVPRGKQSQAREMLEGWWWPRICKALEGGSKAISILEIEAKLDDIREALRRDALPLDMEHVDPPVPSMALLDEMMFVRQLRKIGIGGSRVEFAKRDYYRAFTQRSQWVRQCLVLDGELESFEKKLVEEWQPRFEAMCEKAARIEFDVVKAGQDLYHWVEADARFPFRTVSARFISVGSYHILADGLRLGWHRDFASLASPKDREPDND